MSEKKHKPENSHDIERIYSEAAEHFDVNLGGKKIHPKKVFGRFRNYKNFSWLFWIGYILLPYLRWDGQQAILFDVPNRQFHLFSITVYPQDIWMLAFLLILLAMMLFGITAIAGRVFCGYFCFQTVWTDWFVQIERWIEGSPTQRKKLDAAPWGTEKIRKRAFKYFIWALISLVTGITFVAYFTDAYQLWIDIFTLQAHLYTWVTLLAFFIGTFLFAGFMREQVCLWLCPYARIQSVMIDKDSILPTYDVRRGEPRGKAKKGVIDTEHGDCIDCKVCVAVCPTGVDIRNSALQEGCIMCGVCIDACDDIMDKVDRPRGLIRYTSEKEIDGIDLPPVYKRPRVIIYTAISLFSIVAIVIGLLNIPPLAVTILHDRQPMYVTMSDGSIRNSYTFKVLNKTPEVIDVKISVEGIDGIVMKGVVETVTLKPNKLIPFNVRLEAMPDQVKAKKVPVYFTLTSVNGGVKISERYENFFTKP